MKVLLTGGTGFVGRAVREELLKQGHQVRLLVRPQSRHKWEHLEVKAEVEVLQGDVTDLETMKRASSAVEGVIHLVGIIKEGKGRHESFEWIHVKGTETVVETAQDNGVGRIIFISALGTRPEAPTHFWQITGITPRGFLRNQAGG